MMSRISSGDMTCVLKHHSRHRAGNGRADDHIVESVRKRKEKEKKIEKKEK